MTLPLISIITVVYNAKDDLELTITNSVINQNYKNIEYIVVDGGSTDGTIEIINKHKNYIKEWVSEKDSGVYDAMNKGIDLAAGDYITFLNAGDYYIDENVLMNLFNDIDKNNIDVVYGDINVIDDKRNENRHQKAWEFTLDNLIHCGTGVVCHQAFFVKRKIAPKFNTKYKYKAELNWYFDIVEENNQLRFIHKSLAVVNYHLWGFGYKNFWKNQAEWFKLIIKRYGFRMFIKHKYPAKIWQRVLYRYPKFRTIIKKINKVFA